MEFALQNLCNMERCVHVIVPQVVFYLKNLSLLNILNEFRNFLFLDPVFIVGRYQFPNHFTRSKMHLRT